MFFFGEVLKNLGGCSVMVLKWFSLILRGPGAIFGQVLKNLEGS